MHVAIAAFRDAAEEQFARWPNWQAVQRSARVPLRSTLRFEEDDAVKWSKQNPVVQMPPGDQGWHRLCRFLDAAPARHVITFAADRPNNTARMKTKNGRANPAVD